MPICYRNVFFFYKCFFFNEFNNNCEEPLKVKNVNDLRIKKERKERKKKKTSSFTFDYYLIREIHICAFVWPFAV